MELDKKDAPQSIEVLARVDKAKILGEARRLIREKDISAPQSREVIGHIARLLLSGEELKKAEVGELVTGTMFTFRHEAPGLRQILHWLVKELSAVKNLDVGEFRTLFPNSVAGDAENRNLEADRRRGPRIEGTDNILRPNAIRALCRLYDASNAQSFAKTVDPAIVDGDSSVQSAALISLYHTLPWGAQHLRALQSQIQAAFTQPRSSGSWAWPEYHALGLDYHGRLASEMLAKDFIRSGDGGFKKSRKLQGPATKIFFARFAAELADKNNYRQGAIEFLIELLDSFESIEYDPTVTGDKESFVLKRSMVALEAAKTICQIEDVNPGSLDQAVQKLVEMANNSHQVVKFAAMRTLCSVASSHPDIIRRHNDSIRKQMKNSNKEIGSFATTTLLKTADEADVDSLMKEVGSLMTNASNDFKVVIVEAVTALCLKFPTKKAALAKFLGDYLKDEGSYDFKRAMVEGMFDLVKSIPETKKDVLLRLCEFIEDCEYPSLTIRVLHVVGTEGPTVEHPTIFIRHIYNRLVLENALVRAAAVTALAKFGVGQTDPELKRSVHVLLSRSLDDEDDEVRDRAALSLRLMEDEDDKSRELIRNDSMFSLAEFEDRLAMYVSAEDRTAFQEPFDLSIVPVVSREKARSETRTKKLLGATTPTKPRLTPKADKPSGTDALASSAAATLKKHMQEMQAIPEFVEHGRLLKSSPATEIIRTEYVVEVVKHFFNEHVVFQFNITHDLDDTALQNVRVEFDSQNDFFEHEWSIHSDKLKKNETGIEYASFRKTDVAGRYVPGAVAFESTLKYDLLDTKSSDDSGTPDESQLDPFYLTPADFFMPAFAGSFKNVWGQPHQEEADASMTVPDLKSTQDAAEQIPNILSLQPLDGTDIVSSKYQHELKLYGKTIYGSWVAATVKILRLVDSGQIGVQVKVRSEEEGVAALVLKCFE
ncbi:adaptin N terminal region-domain-containing protein [Phyllosticta citriasiana]|uniref:Coatomer subunit gamma n=1 Tax=Phyllosticta citriasiana TaxID=595635 RepID=A0ABR1KPD6_9PEZI